MSDLNKAPHLPRRKRSARLTLALMGAGAAATLTGCIPEPPPPATPTITGVSFSEPKAYQSVDECEADNIFTRAACEDAFEAAKESVPRFDSKAACEAEHGEGACEPHQAQQAQQQTQQASGGGGSWFGPALMGYMVGNMMASNSNGGSSRQIYNEPVYRTRENRGDWSTASTAAASNLTTNQRQVSQSIQQRTQRMATQKAASTQRATQRSGFGSRSSARGGFGS